MLEGSPGCSHGEEAPRDQPWCWQCSSFGQGKGQTAGKGLQEMLSAVSRHSAGRCPFPAGSGHLLSSSSSPPWGSDHHQLSPGGAGEAGTRLPARGEAEGCDTRVGRSTANHLGQRLLPFPGPRAPRRANKTLSAHPALPGVDGLRSHRQEDRQEGWEELAALQEPARMEMSHPWPSTPGKSCWELGSEGGKRLWSQEKATSSCKAALEHPRCHWMSPPCASAASTGKKPFIGHSSVICFSCCKIRA